MTVVESVSQLMTRHPPGFHCGLFHFLKFKLFKFIDSLSMNPSQEKKDVVMIENRFGKSIPGNPPLPPQKISKFQHWTDKTINPGRIEERPVLIA